MAPGAPASHFRDQLLRAGLLVDAGVEGLYHRSETFEAVVTGLDRFASEAGAPDRPTVRHFPPVLSRADFERTGYLRSFPDLAGAVRTFTGGDAEHAALLGALEAGDDWSALLAPAEVTLSSAGCHPLYPSCTGRLGPGGQRFEIFGHCFRHEPDLDPARMLAFRMHEFVFVGEPDGAVAHRDRWLERGLDLLASLGLAVEAEVATDPFFGRAGRMLATSQREAAAKYEILTTVASEDRPTAIASANHHGDHFGAAFAIETAEGSTAHSACFGFGTERVVLALVRAHGTDVTAWPRPVRERLWP